jgi:hypothetical protein
MIIRIGDDLYKMAPLVGAEGFFVGQGDGAQPILIYHAAWARSGAFFSIFEASAWIAERKGVVECQQ